MTSDFDEIKLIQAVGDWAKKNFDDKRWPEEGVIEEMGEAVHCALKRKQCIRGFEDTEFFLEQMTDAFADAIIYLCDWCNIHQAFFKFGRNQHALAQQWSMDDERKIMMHCFQGATQMLAFNSETPSADMIQVYNVLAQRICTGLETWAFIYGIDLRWATMMTWNKVSVRDWKKEPKNAAN